MDQKLIDRLGPSWANVIGGEFSKQYMIDQAADIRAARTRVAVYPASGLIFRAFRETPFENVKVVWLGQDPYPSPGQATGLAFECGTIKRSPSMDRINDAYDEEFPMHFATDIMSGELSRWAQQGVLLLNTALTVEHLKPGSHTHLWDKFTARVIQALVADTSRPKVFVLLGKNAARFEKLITPPHSIVAREHPQAANHQYRKWNHGKIFSTINNLLKDNGIPQINW